MEDMTVPCSEGLISIRVGAIIMKNGRLLMAHNDRDDYLYTVGGRVKFGETAEEAVIREVMEETGVRLETERLGFINENYFYGDAPTNMGKLIYEIGYYFYMKVPDDFEPVSRDFMEGSVTEHLVWASPDDDITMYPTFFKTELKDRHEGVKFFSNDER